MTSDCESPAAIKSTSVTYIRGSLNVEARADAALVLTKNLSWHWSHTRKRQSRGNKNFWVIVWNGNWGVIPHPASEGQQCVSKHVKTIKKDKRVSSSN